MRIKYLLFYFFLALVPLVYTGCDDDDPEPPNEEEVITTVVLTLTPTAGGAPVVLNFLDADGDGAIPPVITGGTLQANTTYDGAIVFFNAIENEDVTIEVVEEALEHQVFYQTSGFTGITVTYEDADSEGNPLGILTTLSTGNVGGGTLTVILRHEPDKNATGVADGDPTNAGGETDIEVNFPVTIE
jgi:hypothetical protein